MKILLNLMFFLLLSGCLYDSNTEINNTINSFLPNVNTNHYKDIDKSLLSQDLSSLIQKAIERSNVEEAKVKGSTDIPLMIEGEIFSSFPEGWSSYKILDIKTENGKAIVSVQFKFIANLKMNFWKDDIMLVKEETWKVDNVVFKGNKGVGGNTKETLRSFINNN